MHIRLRHFPAHLKVLRSRRTGTEHFFHRSDSRQARPGERASLCWSRREAAGQTGRFETFLSQQPDRVRLGPGPAIRLTVSFIGSSLPVPSGTVRLVCSVWAFPELPGRRSRTEGKWLAGYRYALCRTALGEIAVPILKIAPHECSMAEKSVHNDTYNTLKLNPVSADTGPSSGANDGASLYPSKSVLNAPRHPLLAFPPP